MVKAKLAQVVDVDQEESRSEYTALRHPEGKNGLVNSIIYAL